MIKLPINGIVVDDDEDVADVLYMSLESLPNLHLAKFSDPVAALDYIIKEKVRVAVIDIDMPKLNGDELIKQTRIQCDWPVDFIICSGAQKLLNAIRCYNLGAFGVVVKPPLIDNVIGQTKLLVDKHINWATQIQKYISKS